MDKNGTNSTSYRSVKYSLLVQELTIYFMIIISQQTFWGGDIECMILAMCLNFSNKYLVRALHSFQKLDVYLNPT